LPTYYTARLQSGTGAGEAALGVADLLEGLDRARLGLGALSAHDDCKRGFGDDD
jgi:hypothetical protein